MSMSSSRRKFDEDIDKVNGYYQAIVKVIKEITVLCQHEGRGNPECIDEAKIVMKVLDDLKFSDIYRDLMKDLEADQKDSPSLQGLFRKLHRQETAYRRHHAKKSKKHHQKSKPSFVTQERCSKESKRQRCDGMVAKTTLG